jgi:methylenetetrahydrofolate dehydrogenase (NADP+)/methenyltetrahydrofolate cyclohydrolase
MILLDGKATAGALKKDLATEAALLKIQKGRPPHLAAILVGNSGASETYIASKVKTCQEVGFDSTLIRFDNHITEKELLEKIREVNADKMIDGLIVQMPLPLHISVQRVTETISPSKDVDGFHPVNTGRMVQNLPCYVAATPKGIMLMLEKYQIETAGKDCVILGRSNIVGTPMSVLMSRNSSPGNSTVTLCHSRTKNLTAHLRQADILIAALGNPEFVKGNMVKEGAVVIDVGITRIADTNSKSGYRIKGDIKFDEVAPKCSYITPVPGGVGPMTIIGLMQNTLLAARGDISF